MLSISDNICSLLGMRPEDPVWKGPQRQTFEEWLDRQKGMGASEELWDKETINKRLCENRFGFDPKKYWGH